MCSSTYLKKTTNKSLSHFKDHRHKNSYDFANISLTFYWVLFPGEQAGHVARRLFPVHPEHFWRDPVHPSGVAGGKCRDPGGILHCLHVLLLRK